MYDYGTSGNYEHYNRFTPFRCRFLLINWSFDRSPTPPVYDISKFPTSVPVALFSGGKDALADPTDVSQLVHELPNVVEWDVIVDYAHLDFVCYYLPLSCFSIPISFLSFISPPLIL